MERQFVDVIYDRRKISAKKGLGYLEVRVYLGRNERRYFSMGQVAPEEQEELAHSDEVVRLVKKCEKIIAAMKVLDEDLTMEVFNSHFDGEERKPKMVKVEKVTEEKPDNLKKNFIRYMELALEGEELREGTRRHKVVVIDAVKRFGRLATYGDLTPSNIMAFDAWLHDGTRTDVTCYGYHKNVHKWVLQLFKTGEIPQDPYETVSVKRGKCKEREPLTESELKRMRLHKFNPKLAKVRDLFIFAAYTGLSFCDTQAFDFERMTKKEGDLYYIDGSRIKTDTKYFTPILAPAMKVLEKYDYRLPKISNQKANDYLHVIQMELHIRQNLTFHVARHSFATLALAHDVPIENVARMLGHENIKTTQIYAKILNSTIERHATALQRSIL